MPQTEPGTPGRTRTCDTRFRKPLLFPLSYGGIQTSTRFRFVAVRNHTATNAAPARLHDGSSYRQASIDADGLTRDIRRFVRGEEEDRRGCLFALAVAPQGDPRFHAADPLLVHYRCNHWRVHEPGRDAIRPDVVSRQGAGETLRQRHDSGLRRRVGIHGMRIECGHRRVVDYRAAAVLYHARHGVLAHE